MELLDIVDLNGNPTGEVVERQIAHRDGIRHRTSHVWLLRKKNNEIEILLQKRCETKDSFPLCYDISSAGHIPAGTDFLESALRELEEELGLKVSKNQLIDIGNKSIYTRECFHGKPFNDNQFSKIFILWNDQDSFNFQKEEIADTKWFKFNEVIEDVKNNSIKNCIDYDELVIINNYLNTIKK